MIKDISATGKYLQVSGGGSSTYINNFSGAQGIGNMRYNTSNQNMEVFDGNNWISINMSYASVGLTPDAESLLDWARKKRDEENEREHLAKSNPAIKDLVDQIIEKEEQLKMIMTLIKSPGGENEQRIYPQTNP